MAAAAGDAWQDLKRRSVFDLNGHNSPNMYRSQLNYLKCGSIYQEIAEVIMLVVVEIVLST
ncbi:hypothetical protein OMCYN_00732 [cyanobiont of Ornithocercus magnificus]|nr:hypothetical protein OMCYN_00732 [cyanobiont of Ornithocercus magnificus]